MGRLPSLMPRGGATMTVLGLAAGLVACACENGGEAPPQKSRVQAVLAEPGSSPAPEMAARPVLTAEPKAKRPRPPLCEGQLERKAEPFRPKRAAEQIALDVEQTLPADPLKAASGRWTWVNFWAAWCVPCKEELPLLLGWQAQLKSKLQLAFVSMDDDERQLREFLQRQPAGGLKNTHYLPDGAVRKAWLDALKLETEPELPLQLLLDPSGRLRCRIEGAIEAEDLTALQRILNE